MEFPKLRGSIETVRFPAYVEVKIDGEANYFIKDGDDCYFINKYGKQRRNRLTENLRQQLNTYAQVILFGELFVGDGKNGDLYKLLSNKDNEDELKYIAVDCVLVDGDHAKTEMDSKFLLDSLGILSDQVFTISRELVDTREKAELFFETMTRRGFEGVVVKSQHDPFWIEGSNGWVKMKYKDQSEFEVVLIDPVRERIEVEVNSNGRVRNVGVKCSSKIKRTLSLGSLVVVEHQGILKTGGLRHPVFISKGGENAKTIS